MLMLRKNKGFTIVEILVAVGLVALLMVVAVPRLLDSRKTVSDSTAKQQVEVVRISVNNWFAERDTFVGLTLAVLQARLTEVDIVDATAATGKGTGGRALTVGFLNSTPGSESVTLAASNGDTNCWGIAIAATGTTYYLLEATAPAACTATLVSTGVSGTFEYPRLTS